MERSRANNILQCNKAAHTWKATQRSRSVRAPVRELPWHRPLKVEFGVRNVPFAWLVALQEALGTQHCVLHAYGRLFLIQRVYHEDVIYIQMSMFALLALRICQRLLLSYSHQHGHGHGSNTTGYRSNEASLLLGGGVVDITHHPLPAGPASIWEKTRMSSPKSTGGSICLTDETE